jgi:BA14K-like protein
MTSFCVPKLCAALIAATSLTVASPAGAVPARVQHSLVAVAQGIVQFDRVQYRGQYQTRRSNRFYAGNRYRRDGGRNLALGIGGLVIGGILLSEAARSEHREEHSSDWQRCSETYRSFEPETGMYTGYDGARRTCPYLR